MPVSVSSLFPMAANASGTVAQAADSLAGGGALKSAKQITGSFRSLLGAAQAASAEFGASATPAMPATATPAAAATAMATAPAPEAADLIAAPAAPAVPADSLAGDLAQALPAPVVVEAPAQELAPGAKDAAAVPPADPAEATLANHLVTQALADQAGAPQLGVQAQASETAAPAGEADDVAAGKDDAETHAAKHKHADPADASPPVQAQPVITPVAVQDAAQVLGTIQPALAAPGQDVAADAEDKAADAPEGVVDSLGKPTAKLAKADGSTPIGSAQTNERTAHEPVGHTAQAATAAANPGDGAPNPSAPSADGNLSAPLFTQTLTGAASRPAALPYAPAAQSTPHSATVAVQQGHFGADIGVEIARALDRGGDDLLIRLDPRHMGRIDVRLSFDHDGVLRAVMSADSSSALDMLRRESTDLNRALTDAGIRADAQSLRFDSRSGGQGGQQRWQGGDQPGRQQAQGGMAEGFGGSDDPIYRPLRSSGHVDLMA